MTMIKPVLGAVLAAASLSACASVPLAPGAAQVKITRAPADVAHCKALGNLDLEASAAGIVDGGE